jgi:Na+/proline symporter
MAMSLAPTLAYVPGLAFMLVAIALTLFLWVYAIVRLFRLGKVKHRHRHAETAGDQGARGGE